MAVAEELVVKIRADADKALKDLNAVEKQTGKAEGGFKKFTSFLKTTGVGSFLAVGAAIAATTKLINDSIKAYGIQEEAEASLANALKVTEQYSSSTMNALKDYAAELQNVTKYGDEATISAMAMLQQLGDLSEDGLMAITPLVQDFATAMGVDLNTAASLVGKTLSSSTNALARYGIEIDMTGDKEDKLAQLTEQLGNKFGGAAAAAADTASGSLVQYKNAAGDLKEAIGGVVLNGARPFLEAMTEMTARTAKSINKVREFKEVMDALSDEDGLGVDDIDRVREAIETLNKKIEDAQKMRGRSVSGAADQLIADRNVLEAKLRMLQQLQYQELLRQDAAEAALRRAQEIADEEAKLAAEREKDLANLNEAFSKTKEGEIAALEASIAYFESFIQTEKVIAVLDDLRSKLEDLTSVEVEASTESEAMITAMLSGYEDLSTAADLVAENKKRLHEEELERLQEEKQLRDEVTNSIIGSAFSVASAWADTYAELNEESQRAARIQAGVAKAESLYQIAVSTLAAATKALELGPIAGPIAAGVITALGLANAAAVVSEPIPALAEGGIVTRPTTALIGEAGPEAVVPLSKGGFGNTTIHIHGTMVMQDQVEAFIAGVNAKNNRGY